MKIAITLTGPGGPLDRTIVHGADPDNLTAEVIAWLQQHQIHLALDDRIELTEVSDE